MHLQFNECISFRMYPLHLSTITVADDGGITQSVQSVQVFIVYL